MTLKNEIYDYIIQNKRIYDIIYLFGHKIFELQRLN